jgi:voltage-gated potassium channel
MSNFVLGSVFLTVLLVGGTLGFRLIEGWPLFDSLFMTVITLSTVGYSETHPLSPGGRILAMILIFFGVGSVFYLAGTVVQFMMEGRIREILGRRRLEKEIERLKDHYIICGYGSVGTSICEALGGLRRINLVVVERDAARLDKLEERKMNHIAGEATDEENLLRAGIKRAKGLVAALQTDADNVFVTLTARQLNPNLFIVARAGAEKTESKLLAAGANKVVSPYRMGGHRIAQIISRPTVTDFLELTTMDPGRSIQMEEMPVHPSSGLVDIALQDSGIRKKLELIIVAIRKPGGEMLFNPSSQTRLQGGDTVVAIGEKKSLERFGKMLNPEGQIL